METEVGLITATCLCFHMSGGNRFSLFVSERALLSFTLSFGHGYWKRCTLQKSSAMATILSLCDRHRALMSVPSEPSNHTPGARRPHNGHHDDVKINITCRTERTERLLTHDVEAQHAGVGRPLPVFALEAVPQQLAA